MPAASKTTSRKAQLQSALGDLGEVLDRVPRGEGRFQAAGWYARIGPGLVYLGDHTGVAFATIGRLVAADEQEPEEPALEPGAVLEDEELEE